MSNSIRTFVTVWYACKAGIAGGLARCRNQEGHCASHPTSGHYAAAPRPTTVLFKVKLSPNGRSRFAKVEANYLTLCERRRREEDRVADAEGIGRKAYGVRLDAASDRPEGADSGCPVFGATTGGLKKVDVRDLEAELRAAGFKMTEASVAVTPGKPGQPMNSVLVLAFSTVGEEDITFPSWGDFRSLVSSTFGFVHVWANPTKDDGTTVHTVNCLSRQDGKPDYALRYANGDWAAESVAAS